MGKGANLGEFEELVLLAVAGLEGGAHGAGIHEHILDTTGRDVSVASVYVTLARLERKRHLTSAVDVGGEERAGRPRKIFRLTAGAVAELRQLRLVRARLWESLDFDPLGSAAAE